MSGKGERSPAHPPLRTVRETFTSYGSSTGCLGMPRPACRRARLRARPRSTPPCAPSARCFQDRPRWHCCPSRSPIGVLESLPYTGTEPLPLRPAPAGSLQPFGSWQISNHYPAHYRRAFAFSRFLCPQRRPSPLRVRYPPFGGSATGLPSSAVCIWSPAALGVAYGPGGGSVRPPPRIPRHGGRSPIRAGQPAFRPFQITTLQPTIQILPHSGTAPAASLRCGFGAYPHCHRGSTPRRCQRRMPD